MLYKSEGLREYGESLIKIDPNDSRGNAYIGCALKNFGQIEQCPRFWLRSNFSL